MVVDCLCPHEPILSWSICEGGRNWGKDRGEGRGMFYNGPRLKGHRVFIKYCVFFLKMWYFFRNSASSAAALVFNLPGGCTHTDTLRENRERPEAGII